MRQTIAVVIFAIVIGWLSVSVTGQRPSSTIPDVSWPNCTLKNHPTGDSGIIGINGGLAFRSNPCLAEQTAWFKDLSVYVNTGYPGMQRALKFQHSPNSCAKNDEECLAYNYGYNAGLYSIRYSLLKGVIAHQWWLDVETENSWSDKVNINRSALRGTLDAVSRFAGTGRVGFYSYPGQWNLLTGDWHNYYPAWVATGSRHLVDAELACSSPSFNGGAVILAQFVPSLDENLSCK